MRKLLPFAALVLVACATTTPPEIAPAEINQYLADPRTVETGPPARGTARRASFAWKAYQAGRLEEAERLYTEILARDADHAPASLGLTAIALSRGEFDRAEEHLDRAAELLPGSDLVKVYRAELARARGDLRTAYSIYRQLPSATERFEEIRGALFSQLFSQAISSTDTEAAITLLREALDVDSDSDTARRLLARRLVEMRRFDEARSELDPLLLAGRSDDPEVQELGAEIDVGMGRYQEAISRYERLVRQSGSAAYRRRLDEIKQEWSEANMPPQQRRALDAAAITRADLAVLIYWNVPDVRFAQNLPEPPIAIDIADVIGREELIRAMSLRFFPVDPLTRRVEPYRLVTAGNLLRILSRIAILRGLPPCAAESSREPNEAMRALRILEACGVPVAELSGDPEAYVSGRVAERALAGVATLLKSAEQRQARQ